MATVRSESTPGASEAVSKASSGEPFFGVAAASVFTDAGRTEAFCREHLDTPLMAGIRYMARVDQNLFAHRRFVARARQWRCSSAFLDAVDRARKNRSHYLVIY